MKILWLAAVFSLATSLAPVAAQAPSQDEVVTVRPESVEQQARTFTHEITVAPSTFPHAPIWHTAVCPSFMGLTPAIEQQVLDRFTASVRSVGVSVLPPGCAFNVLVIFTNDVAGLLAEAQRNRLGYFAIDQRNGVSMGRGAWRDFVDTPRPIRWWHVSMLMTRDNTPADQRIRPTGNDNGGTFVGGSVVRDSSIIHQPTHLNLHHVFIVVDVARVNGFPIDALADYVAMVSLAQIDPTADIAGAPTILNLFANGEARQLTDWDRAYLRGLYAAIPEASHPAQQQRDIAHRMANDLNQGQ